MAPISRARRNSPFTQLTQFRPSATAAGKRSTPQAEFLQAESNPAQAGPRKWAWIVLDSLVRFRAFQRVTSNPNQKNSRDEFCILLAPATGLEAWRWRERHWRRGSARRIRRRAPAARPSPDPTFSMFCGNISSLSIRHPRSSRRRSRQRTFQFRASSRSSRTLIRLPVDPGQSWACRAGRKRFAVARLESTKMKPSTDFPVCTSFVLILLAGGEKALKKRLDSARQRLGVAARASGLETATRY